MFIYGNSKSNPEQHSGEYGEFALTTTMRLEEGQVWHKAGQYLRIIHRERLAVEYKALADLRSKEGTEHWVTKKEFCRLLKGATLLTPAQVRELKGLPPKEVNPAEDSDQWSL